MFRNSTTVAMMRQTALFACTSACLAKKTSTAPAPATKKAIAASAAAASRFKSTPLQSTKDVSKGTTPSSKIFSKSFFGSGADKKSDDWLNLDDSTTPVKKGAAAATKTAVRKGTRGTVAEPQRRPAGVRRPFSIHSDTEKAAYLKAVRRNMLALKNTTNAADAAKKELVRLATKKQTSPSPTNTATLKRNQRRTHSPFFSDTALRNRGGSGTVAVAPKKSARSTTPTAAAASTSSFVDDHVHSAHKPLSGSDGMNPIAITQSFFTTYERRQFNRLQHATRSMRLRLNRTTGNIETVSMGDVRRRYGLYNMWDKLILNVNNVNASTPVKGLPGKSRSKKN